MAGLGLSNRQPWSGTRRHGSWSKNCRIPANIAAERKISSVAFNPDGSLLATATHHSPLVAMYNTATWEEDVGWAEAMKTEPEGKGAHVAAFSPNGKWLVTGGDGLTIWDTATKKKIARIEKIKPWSFAFSADSGMLAVGGAGWTLAAS